MSARVLLVPLDGSVQAACALPVAHAIARIETAEVRIVAAAPLGPTSLGVDPSELRGAPIEPTAGAPLGEGTLRRARQLDAKMIVTSSSLGRAGSPAASETANREVLEGAPCPVVLVPSGPSPRPWTPRRVLMPHDGAPSTSIAIEPAAELASRAGARLSVLYVASARPTVGEPGSLAWPRYVDQAQHEWPAWVSEFLERVSGAWPLAPDELDLSSVAGEPGQEILRFAAGHDIDLIALAFRGQLRAGHAPTLRTVVAGAPCPVMVLRAVGRAPQY